MHIERIQVGVKNAKLKNNRKVAKEQKVHSKSKKPKVHP
jgi:hypothetical protein